MSDELKLEFDIVGQDRASAVLREVTQSLTALDRQARRTAESLKRAFGADMVKPMAAARTEAERFGTGLAEAAERAAKALRADVAAVAELRIALRSAITDEKALGNAIQAAHTAGTSAGRAHTTSARNAASVRAKAAGGDLRMVRQLWRVREASARAERREIDAKTRAETVATERRVRDVGRLWRMRERSEGAEMRHLRAVSRERDALRRRALSSGQHAAHQGHRALRSLNHPVHESVGFALAAGAAAGGAFAEHVVRASEAFDTSMARLRMFAPDLDADAIRKQSLGDSISLGVDASTIVDTIAKSVRDGVPAEIARTLPKSIVQTAQVMGGDIERLTDSLAEGIQESTAMGWIKNQSDARRFLNLEAGLSTTAGNTSAKTEQFIAAGGLGHGKEMGLDLTNTMAYGAMLNASGSRTGQASARFMGQLSQNVPKMYDKYRTAVESHKNSEEDRAVRSAPGKLGYGGVREMQSRIMAGPEGLIDFATRLQRLDDKARKLTLEGYGFSEQGGAMLAELGSNGGAKGKAVLARAKELADQKEANDYLSEKFGEWSKSLSFMLQQVEKGWHAIENEIGDVIKDDVIGPLRDWWVELSEAIVHSDLKDRVHAAIMGFVHGLGFEDVRHALDAITRNAKGFDLAGLAKGVGEGVRSAIDSFRSLAGVFGGAGGISAETVGRVATEMLELSLALKAVSPVLSVLTGVIEGVRALGAVLKTAQTLGLLMGVAGAGEGAGALATIGAGAAATGVGLTAMLGIAVVGGALAVAVMNWDDIKAAMGLGPKEDPVAAAARPVKRLEDQSWWDFLTGRGVDNVPLESDNDRAARLKAQADEASRKAGETLGITRGPHGGVTAAPGGIHPSAYESGENWRNLMTPASYSPSDAGDVARDAMVDTARGVVEVRNAVDRLATVMRTASTAGQGSGSSDGGGSGGAGLSNMRYGRSASGAYRSSPGGRGAGGGGGMTAVSKDLTPESRALLDTLASGEAPDYNVMNGGGRFSDYSHHPGGRAAGRYQFLPSTWRRVSGALGLKDFSPESQDKGAWWLAQSDYRTRTGRDLQADLKSKDPARIAAVGRALHSTWVSLNGSFGGKYGSYLGRQGSGGVANAGGGASARGQVRGNLQIGDETFRYGSGGAGGSASVPFGDYPINPDAPGAWGRAHNAMAVNGTGSIWDKSLGRMRTGIEMHAASTAAMVTHGCLGFMKGEYPKLKARVREMIAKTGHAYLHVGPNGATITPDAVGVTKPATPDEIARKVKGTSRGRPSTGDAPGGSMTMADNSMVNHFHIHGAYDAHHVARTIVGHLDRRSGGMTIDRDAFA